MKQLIFGSILLSALLQSTQSVCPTYFRGSNYGTQSFAEGQVEFNNGIQVTGTIPFTQFCSTPQIIITNLQYKMDMFASFVFKIATVTTSSFTVYLIFPSYNYKVYWLTFDWVAVLDDRVFVINDFMDSLSLTNSRTQLIPYPISNVNFEISCKILSYSGGTPYVNIKIYKIVIEKQSSGFNLYITGVDSDQLSGLRVQIVAGLKPIFYFFDSTSLNPGAGGRQYFTKAYSKFSYPLLVQKNMFQSIEYFLSNYDTLTDVLVKYWCIVQLKAGQPTSTGEVQLFLFDLLYEPHYNYKVRVTQVMSLDHRVINTFNTQKFYFKEIDTTFTDIDVGMASVNNYNNQALSMIYSHQCQPRRKIIVTTLRKSDTGQYTYSTNCHNLYNLINMHFYFYQARTTLAKFTIQINEQGLQLRQEMLDSGLSFLLLNIVIQNQV